jgi:3-dehydroquinate synthase
MKSQIFCEHHLIDNLDKTGLFQQDDVPKVLFYDDNLQETQIKTLTQKIRPSLTIPIESCEDNKSADMLIRLQEILLTHKMAKNTIFIAAGGGTVTDLIGFLAATYFCGVTLMLIPTTLLCMVDACVGGKTAVNLLHFKNRIGTLYPAHHIFIDPQFLSTLPDIQMICGMAEVIKYGLIFDHTFYDYLKKSSNSFEKKDPHFLKDIISTSLQIKTDIVTQDPWDLSLRRILNFGHTIGHAIETDSQYAISHGLAIAAGMCIEAHISFARGFLSYDALEGIFALFVTYRFPFASLQSMTVDRLYPLILLDKKNSGKHPRSVILSSIGSTLSFDGNYVDEISLIEITNAINWFTMQVGNVYEKSCCDPF